MKTDKLLKIIAVLFTATLMLQSNFAIADQPYHYARNTYTHGQHAEVAYEGWRENEDGTLASRSAISIITGKKNWTLRWVKITSFHQDKRIVVSLLISCHAEIDSRLI
ncbi:MAG: hypothetical protein JKY98_07655 [Gammaproteobacteria bacterium]|nr:hypothetical protein [Gammaproteobacteria bacterium]